MIYYDVKTLGDLIKAFYEQHRGSEYLDEVKVVESWPKVVGPFIASHQKRCALCPRRQRCLAQRPELFQVLVDEELERDGREGDC